MADEAKGSLWLVRIGAAILLICLTVRAFASGVFSLYAIVSIVLAALWIAFELLLPRDGFGLFRPGVLVLLLGSTCTFVLGKYPGLLFASLSSAIALILAIAVISAVASGSIRGAGARFTVALLWSVAGAAWQLGVAPLFPTLLIRN